jgi:hypothetical protein
MLHCLHVTRMTSLCRSGMQRKRVLLADGSTHPMGQELALTDDCFMSGKASSRQCRIRFLITR